jgi:hypothetical protein
MKDYSDRILDSVYIGRREGFMDELDGPLRELANDSSLGCTVTYSSPNQAIKQLVDKLGEHIGDY